MSSIKRLLFGAAVVLVVTSFSAGANAEKKIGILTFSGEARYVEAKKGIEDTLRKGGFAEPKATFIVEDAAANQAQAAKLVQKFAAAKLDLIITLGTSATVAMSREIQDVPIVFSVVYDPVEIGTAKSWKSSGNNTTGSSSKIPMSRLMETLKNFPKVKRLAVLYTPGEKNSELTLKDLQSIQGRYAIKVIPVSLTTIEEISQLLPKVLRSVNAVYVTGANLVNGQISIIVDMAIKDKVITVTHLDDLVDKGVLVGVCANAYSMGQVAGEKALKILRGAKPSSIPVGTARKVDVLLNAITAKKGNYQIPATLMRTVTKK